MKIFLKKYHYLVILLSIFSTQLSYSSSMIITSSGLYQLGDNINFTPTAADDIITISASNVLLDLNQRFITQSNTQANVNGINILNGFSNVHIRNGTINNITGTGVLVNSGCSRIFIEDIVTFSCDTCGVHLAGSLTSSITDSYINRTAILSCCKGNSTTVASALAIQFCSRVNLQNIDVYDCGTTSRSLSTLDIDNTSKSRLSFFDVTANTAGGTFFRGFDLSAVTDCEFFKCTVKENTSSTAGMTFSPFNFQSTTFTCTSNVFKECMVINHTITDGTSTFTGFNIQNNNNNNYFENCLVMQNTVGGAMVGFGLLNTTNNFLNRCISENNDSTTRISTGCFITTCTSPKLVDCVAADHTGTTVIGINFMSCTSGEFIRCISHDNVGTALGIGIRLNGCTRCIGQDSIASRNAGPATATSFGYVLAADTNSIFLRNTGLNNGTTAGNNFSGFGFNNNTTVSGTNTNTNSNPWTNFGITG